MNAHKNVLTSVSQVGGENFDTLVVNLVRALNVVLVLNIRKFISEALSV